MVKKSNSFKIIFFLSFYFLFLSIFVSCNSIDFRLIMYGHNQFSQSPHYGSQYPASYPPYGGNYYYPVYSAWSQGGDVGPPGQEDPTVVILNKRQENQLMIENFIAGVEESSKVDAKKPSVEEKTLRISEARDAVINAFRKILELEKLREKLNSDCNSSDVDWQKKYRDCTAIRDDLVEMMKKFGDDEGVVETLKKQVNRRRKKRLREAGKRAAWKVKKSLNAERRAQLHAEADAWIREKQDIIEREKQVESLRKDADIVLSDVRAKRSDARKFLGLLQELQNLRRIKVSIARARGENLPLAADQAFDNIIGKYRRSLILLRPLKKSNSSILILLRSQVNCTINGAASTASIQSRSEV